MVLSWLNYVTNRERYAVRFIRSHRSLFMIVNAFRGSFQFQDLLKFIQQASNGRPLVISGDFNAEPTEPVYTTMINDQALGLSSAYADLMATLADSEDKSDANDSDSIDSKNGEAGEEKSRAEFLINNEPPFTTWKIREDGEVCHTIDYVFYSQDKFKVIIKCDCGRCRR